MCTAARFKNFLQPAAANVGPPPRSETMGIPFSQPTPRPCCLFRRQGCAPLISGSQVRALVRPPLSLPKPTRPSSQAERPFLRCHFWRVVVSNLRSRLGDIVSGAFLRVCLERQKIPFQTRRGEKVRDELARAPRRRVKGKRHAANVDQIGKTPAKGGLAGAA